MMFGTCCVFGSFDQQGRGNLKALYKAWQGASGGGGAAEASQISRTALGIYLVLSQGVDGFCRALWEVLPSPKFPTRAM